MVTPGATQDDLPAPRTGSLRWWISDRQGETALAFWPNPALVVWMVTVVVGWTDALEGDRGGDLKTLGQGALIVWALDELVRGASPARRVLGAAVLGAQLLWFFT